MSSHQRTMINHLPMSLFDGAKSDVRTQFGALCYRWQKKKLQILLITSRTAKRWIVPKGWPMDGKSPLQCAEIEAWEEAGATGVSDGRCIGIFSFAKQTCDGIERPCVAMIFAIEVQNLADEFPEVSERKRKWMSRKKAAKLVREPELSRIILDFDPRQVD